MMTQKIDIEALERVAARATTSGDADTGLIGPSGTMYATGFQGHLDLAVHIFSAAGYDVSGDVLRKLIKLGFIRVEGGTYLYLEVGKMPTESQMLEIARIFRMIRPPIITISAHTRGKFKYMEQEFFNVTTLSDPYQFLLRAFGG